MQAVLTDRFAPCTIVVAVSLARKADMDRLTPERRSEVMSRIRRRDTPPELAVRRCLHRLGFRFRLHLKNLPGTPDIVLKRRRAVIFVHGCFWHGRPDCYRAARVPKSNVDYRRAKVERNQARDRRVADELRAAARHVLTVWECRTTNPERLAAHLSELLGCFKRAGDCSPLRSPFETASKGGARLE